MEIYLVNKDGNYSVTTPVQGYFKSLENEWNRSNITLAKSNQLVDGSLALVSRLPLKATVMALIGQIRQSKRKKIRQASVISASRDINPIIMS